VETVLKVVEAEEDGEIVEDMVVGDVEAEADTCMMEDTVEVIVVEVILLKEEVGGTRCLLLQREWEEDGEERMTEGMEVEAMMTMMIDIMTDPLLLRDTTIDPVSLKMKI